MTRAITIFIVGTVVLVGLIIAAGVPLMANPKMQAAGGGVLFLSVLVPMAMAYIAHRASGCAGNPFKGLGWGPTGMYFAVWIGAIGVGIVAAALSMGLGLARFDPEMTDYIDMAKTQAEAKGTKLPKRAESGIRIVGMVTAFAGPTIGPWFLTAILCLSSFPWLGFLYRRLMVYGKVQAMFILLFLWLLISSSGGLINNPMAADMSTSARMLLNGLMGGAMAPVLVWLFLRSGSAVIPALAQATWQGILSTCTVLFSDVNMALAVPMGAIAILCVLLAGAALWIWKDPGGESLEVAAVAADGTPLTRQQLKDMQRREEVATLQPGAPYAS